MQRGSRLGAPDGGAQVTSDAARAIIAMLQRDKEDLQRALEAAKQQPTAQSRARAARELELCQQRLDESTGARAARAGRPHRPPRRKR